MKLLSKISLIVFVFMCSISLAGTPVIKARKSSLREHNGKSYYSMDVTGLKDQSELDVLLNKFKGIESVAGINIQDKDFSKNIAQIIIEFRGKADLKMVQFVLKSAGFDQVYLDEKQIGVDELEKNVNDKEFKTEEQLKYEQNRDKKVSKHSLPKTK